MVKELREFARESHMFHQSQSMYIEVFFNTPTDVLWLIESRTLEIPEFGVQKSITMFSICYQQHKRHRDRHPSLDHKVAV